MKHDNQKILTVEQRIRAVMHAKLVEDPLARISISELCRLAKVNRAGLYAHHQHLLDEIRQSYVSPQEKKPEVVKRKKRVPLFNSEKAEALLYLCLELQLEIQSLRALVPPAPNPNNSRKRKISGSP